MDSHNENYEPKIKQLQTISPIGQN